MCVHVCVLPATGASLTMTVCAATTMYPSMCAPKSIFTMSPTLSSAYCIEVVVIKDSELGCVGVFECEGVYERLREMQKEERVEM